MAARNLWGRAMAAHAESVMTGRASAPDTTSIIHLNESSVPLLVFTLLEPRHGAAPVRPRRASGDRVSFVHGRILRVRGQRDGRGRRREARTRVAAVVLRDIRRWRELVQPAHTSARSRATAPSVRGLHPQ